MNPLRLAGLAALVAGLALSTACSAKISKTVNWDDKTIGQSRWSATYTHGGESIPLALILMTQDDGAGPARLLALSAFGATLGDCLVEKGRAKCHSAPGANGLLMQISGAVGAMLQQDAGFLLSPGRGPGQSGSAGWQAVRGPEGAIEYQPTSSNWILVMKKMEKE